MDIRRCFFSVVERGAKGPQRGIFDICFTGPRYVRPTNVESYLGAAGLGTNFCRRTGRLRLT